MSFAKVWKPLVDLSKKTDYAFGDVLQFLNEKKFFWDGKDIVDMYTFSKNKDVSFLTPPKSLEVSDINFNPYYWSLQTPYFWVDYDIRRRISQGLIYSTVPNVIISTVMIGDNKCLFYVFGNYTFEDIKWQLLNPGVPLKILDNIDMNVFAVFSKICNFFISIEM